MEGEKEEKRPLIMSRVVPLDVPIDKLNSKEEKTGDKIKELRMGRMKAKHLKLIPSDFLNSAGKSSIALADLAKLMPLIASLTGIKEKEAEELDVVDLLKIAEALTVLLGG